MIYTLLPYNPIIGSMRYHQEVIHIEFKKPKGLNEIRSYNVNMELAYRLFYSKTANQALSIYNEIKKQGRFIQVTIKN